MKIFDFLFKLEELNQAGADKTPQPTNLQALPVTEVIKQYWPLVRKALVLVKYLTNEATDKKIDTFITYIDVLVGVLPVKK